MTLFEKGVLFCICLLALTGLLGYAAGFLGVPPVLSLVVAALCAGSIVNAIPTDSDHNRASLKYAVAFIFTSVILLTSFLFYQRFDQYGLALEKYNAHDALWHIALMKSIDQSLPPENPLLSGVTVTGYHYFTDIFWVGVHQFTGAQIEQLYIFVSPLVLTTLLAASTYLLAQTIFRSKVIQLLAAGIALFGGGLGYYATLLFAQAKPGDSVFWLDQSVQYAINHQLVFSLAVANIILWLIYSSTKKYWWVIGILLGSLAGIKVYAVLIYLPALFILGLWRLVIKREWQVLASVLVATLIAGVTLWSAQSNLGWPFIWAPGWFIKTMFESGNHLNWSTWEIHRQLFTQTNNLPRLLLHWGWAGALFLFGNLGLKLIGVLLLVVLLVKNKFSDLFDYEQPFFWIIIAFGATLAPILFIQKGVVWNTIQFMHFAQVPLALAFVWALQKSQLRIRWKGLVLTIVLLISLPTTLMMINFNLQQKNYTVYPIEVIEHLEALSDLPSDTQILVGSSLYISPIVPAMSGRPVWWSDPTILTILGQEDPSRKKYIDQIETGEVNCYSGQVFIYLENQLPRTTACPLAVPPSPVIPTDQEQLFN